AERLIETRAVVVGRLLIRRVDASEIKQQTRQPTIGRRRGRSSSRLAKKTRQQAESRGDGSICDPIGQGLWGPDEKDARHRKTTRTFSRACRCIVGGGLVRDENPSCVCRRH